MDIAAFDFFFAVGSLAEPRELDGRAITTSRNFILFIYTRKIFARAQNTTKLVLENKLAVEKKSIREDKKVLQIAT